MVKKKLKLEPKCLEDRLSRTMLADSLTLAATQRNINMDYEMEERIRKLEDRFQKEVRKEGRKKSGRAKKAKAARKKFKAKKAGKKPKASKAAEKAQKKKMKKKR